MKPRFELPARRDEFNDALAQPEWLEPELMACFSSAFDARAPAVPDTLFAGELWVLCSPENDPKAIRL
jgi:hypothetical protein